jgi:hypothetical protein
VKTTVSVPDELFAEAERLRFEMGTSRSELYGRALLELLARHASDRLTEALDRVLDEVGGEADGFIRDTSRRTLQRVEW